MTTTDQIIGILALPPNQARLGKVHYLQREARLPQSRVGPRMRQLLDEVGEHVEATPKAPMHPGQEIIRAQYARDQDADLSPVELAWLSRLPLDPAEVSFQDAARLAAMAASVSPMKTPASARLIDSVWAPVRELHDERVVRAEREIAAREVHPMPGSALDAMVEALQADNTNLGLDALTLEAENILGEFSQQQHAARDQAIAQADQRLDEIEQGRAARTATTFEVPA